MRLTTWNVNGIRNPFSYQPWNTARTFPAMFDILGSDIIVMQELKIQRKDLRDDMVMLDGWDCYFSLPKHKKGYSGVGMYTRSSTCAPVKAEEGVLGVLPSPSGVPYCELPEGESIGGYPSAFQVAKLGVDPALLDAEGRCLILEFPAFVLLGVYSPANSNGLRDDFRYGFICMLDCRIRNLIRAGKNVVLVGDLNVSRDEMDGASAIDDMRKAGLVHEDYISTPNRRIFNHLLIGGEVVGARDEGRESGILWDTTRAFHPDRKGMYTHWEQKINARPGNFGSRIDFVLISEAMQSWVKDADIQEGLFGSDHCPVYADFHDTIRYDGRQVKMIDVMSQPGVFEDGVRKKEWKVYDAPAYSGKRLPEFDKRRSIKSMFAAPASSKPPPSATCYSVEPLARADVSTAASAVIVKQSTEVSGNALSAQLTVQVPESTASSGPPALKRKASGSDKLKTSKRQKPAAVTTAPRGQQSLKGFFSKGNASPTKVGAGSEVQQPDYDETTATADAPTTPIATTPPPPDSHDNGMYELISIQKSIAATASPGSQIQSPGSAFTASPSTLSAISARASQTQRTWNTLFARPVAPKCEEHTEPCKTMQTKKKGSNQGRSFWMCARPLGPSGQKEKGTQWRCATFIWCSDWVARKDENRAGGENG
ncbi:Class II abasic (AP) endonuclease [Teratosphaeriaceae sp. CCFEE 6253]|nr:Class II abasic (AP) endonuclease [Teratosphaeriaceae sp. CCFEE 6253]